MKLDKKKPYQAPHAEAIIFALRDTVMWMAQSEMGGTQMSKEKDSWQPLEWETEESNSEE